MLASKVEEAPAARVTRYHFISGLPRAGSTLLAALLRQNPAVRANIVSPVGSLVAALLKDMAPDNETSLFLEPAQREALLRGLFDSYYGALPADTAVFDTNRGWTGRLDLLARLFPDCRVVCCVRPVPWIIDSVERLIRRNVFDVSKIFGSDVGGTAYSRADVMMGPSGLIGFPLNAMKQAMHGDHSARLLLLPYDTLAEHPQETLAAVYEFCGLPSFQHDVENVAFDAAEFDARLGTPGLHAVRPRVAREGRETILPPDLWARWEGASVWRDPAFHRRVAVGGAQGSDQATGQAAG